MCVVHLIYLHDLMPSMFCACEHLAHMHVPFKLWVICTAYRNILGVKNGYRYTGTTEM